MRRGSGSGKANFLEFIRDRASPIVEYYDIDEKPDAKKSRTRRLSLDERRLDEQRSRKMSVSSYITDGGFRRLSSLCTSDEVQADFRGRRRSECLSLCTDLNMRVSNNLFAPRAQKDTGSSTISMMNEPLIDVGGPKIQYENSYRMDVGIYIDVPLIKHMISEILIDRFKDMKYSCDKSIMGGHVKKATNAILAAVKSLQLDRYKIVTTVTIAQNNGQGIRESSRCLWSSKSDTWTDASYMNSTMVAHGTVYMIYFE